MAALTDGTVAGTIPAGIAGAPITSAAQKTAVANTAPPQITPGAPAVTAPSPTKTKEPTVLGSTNIDQKNQENVSKVTSTPPPGQVVGADGVARNADGSPASAPTDSTPVVGDDGNTYYANGAIKYATATKATDDPFAQKIYDQLTSLKGQMDATGAANIASIEAQYAGLIDAQKQANKGAEAGTYSLLARGGSLQTDSSSGIMQAQVSYGLQKISDLVGEENAATIKAQQAMQDGDYKILDQQLSIASDARKERIAAAERVSNTIIQQKKDLQAKLDANDKEIHSLIADAAKGGATPEATKAMNDALANHDWAAAMAAGAPFFQDPTSTAGQYSAYVKAATAKGLTPATPGDWMLQQKVKEAYATQSAKNQSDAAYTASDKTQQKLEQEYRQTLGKEFSARTGSLGIENAKVNQANHLNSLFQQYYDPKTGNYNIPTAQYAELAIGLASMISPTGQSSDADRAEIKSKTGSGDLKGAIQYITGVPQNGNTQAIIKNLIDSVDRQAQTAERNRQAALDDMKALAPTDLEPSRVDALNKATDMVSYEGQDRISKTAVDTYVKAHPADAESIAKLYEVPGATDKDIEDYLKAQGKL